MSLKYYFNGFPILPILSNKYTYYFGGVPYFVEISTNNIFNESTLLSITSSTNNNVNIDINVVNSLNIQGSTSIDKINEISLSLLLNNSFIFNSLVSSTLSNLVNLDVNNTLINSVENILNVAYTQNGIFTLTNNANLTLLEILILTNNVSLVSLANLILNSNSLFNNSTDITISSNILLETFLNLSVIENFISSLGSTYDVSTTISTNLNISNYLELLLNYFNILAINNGILLSNTADLAALFVNSVVNNVTTIANKDTNAQNTLNITGLINNVGVATFFNNFSLFLSLLGNYATEYGIIVLEEILQLSSELLTDEYLVVTTLENYLADAVNYYEVEEFGTLIN